MNQKTRSLIKGIAVLVVLLAVLMDRTADAVAICADSCPFALQALVGSDSLCDGVVYHQVIMGNWRQ